MKNWIRATLAVFVLVACLVAWGESDKPLLNQPFVVQNWSNKILTLMNGSASSDSLMVHDDAGNGVRRIAPIATHLAPYALTSSLAGYVPTSRTLTINGTPFDLSANRSWTIPVNTYTAGTGLNLVGSTFNNTAPDQTVS